MSNETASATATELLDRARNLISKLTSLHDLMLLTARIEHGIRVNELVYDLAVILHEYRTGNAAQATVEEGEEILKSAWAKEVCEEADEKIQELENSLATFTGAKRRL